MRVLHSNLLDQATITGPAPVSGELKWLQDNMTTRKVTFASNIVDLVVDLGTAQLITASAIAGHNLGPDSMALWRVEGNTTDDWLNPPYQSNWFRGWKDRVGIIYSDDVNDEVPVYRFFRFRFENPAGDPLILTRLFAGLFVESPRGIAYGFKRNVNSTRVRTVRPSGTINRSGGAELAALNGEIKNADAFLMDAFVEAIPFDVCFVDPLWCLFGRTVDVRAWGDIINNDITDPFNNKVTASFSVTNQGRPTSIDDGPADDTQLAGATGAGVGLS